LSLATFTRLQSKEGSMDFDDMERATQFVEYVGDAVPVETVAAVAPYHGPSHRLCMCNMMLSTFLSATALFMAGTALWNGNGCSNGTR
jgi:hypothetical protein